MIDRKNKNFRAGAIITGIMLVIILVGLIWTPYDPNAMSASAKMAKPSLQHLLGADNFGRDIFSRVVEGAGATFLIATASVAIGLVVGLIIGGLTTLVSLVTFWLFGRMVGLGGRDPQSAGYVFWLSACNVLSWIC
ncbi:MAG: hypothetical protein IIY95_02275, partial [Firmicutes bacterium]|nr:hypothetical protein [Bacillota bacterium]